MRYDLRFSSKFLSRSNPRSRFFFFCKSLSRATACVSCSFLQQATCSVFFSSFRFSTALVLSSIVRAALANSSLNDLSFCSLRLSFNWDSNLIFSCLRRICSASSLLRAADSFSSQISFSGWPVGFII